MWGMEWPPHLLCWCWATCLLLPFSHTNEEGGWGVTMHIAHSPHFQNRRYMVHTCIRLTKLFKLLLFGQTSSNMGDLKVINHDSRDFKWCFIIRKLTLRWNSAIYAGKRHQQKTELYYVMCFVFVDFSILNTGLWLTVFPRLYIFAFYFWLIVEKNCNTL